jgi:hypothetical protein
MQTILDAPTSVQLIKPVEAQQTANTYLLRHIAPGIETASPILAPGDRPTWRMLVRLCDRESTATVGTIEVDAQSGKVIPLTAEQVEDMQDRLREHIGEAKGILRPTAQIIANGYLTNYVSLFVKADRPVFVNGKRPVWRSTVFLRLQGHGRVCDLGTIDVDAQTGKVIPLTHQQLQTVRKCIQDAAQRTAPATAPTR